MYSSSIQTRVFFRRYEGDYCEGNSMGYIFTGWPPPWLATGSDPDRGTSVCPNSNSDSDCMTETI